MLVESLTVRDSLTGICDAVVHCDLACVHLMHGLSIFCHSWQIADHTHIFSLPLPHKLWLHMGKHSLPQECNKPQPTPRTHSRDSPMEFPPMVSHWSIILIMYSGGWMVCAQVVLQEWGCGPLHGALLPVSYKVSAVLASELCEDSDPLPWGQR